MMIPTRLADLDKAHTRFAQPTSHEALSSKRPGRAWLDAVSVENRLRLFGNIEQFRNLPLHFERQFVRLDDTVELIGSSRRRCKLPIHRLHQIDLVSLNIRRGLRFQVRKISRVVDLRPLIVM